MSGKRKRNGIRKSTFREIRKSLGRFLAIFAIIALGVGFFAGLKVTRQAMVTTVGAYLENHGFFELRLLSTLGFEREDAEFFRSQEGVTAAEGVVSIDVLLEGEDGNQRAVKTYSLSETLNTVELKTGRMPQRSDECVADSLMFGEDKIGSTVKLSESNEEDTLESFAHRTYTVVGLVQSPLYIQYERGNTSLGTGRLSGFVYLPASGYDVDYYTDIYVSFDEHYELYSEAYDTLIEGKKETWETLAETAANRRYREILEEAEEKLADAREELADKRREGEEELADAAQKLSDAEQELADGEQALSDAKRELADAEETLADKGKELADGKETLAEKRQEFADAERELADAIAEWKKNDAEVEAGKRQIDSFFETLNEQKEELSRQEEELNAKLPPLLEAEGQLRAVIAQLSALGQDTSAYEAQLAQVQGGLAQLQEGLAQLQEGFAQLESAERALQSAQAEVSTGDELLSKIWWEELVPAQEELEEGRQELSDAEAELSDGEQALADAEEELADAKQTLSEKEQELADAKVEYQDGKQEYEDALREFEEKIADAEEELADAEEEISEIEEPECFVLDRGTNVGYVCFENDSSIVDGIANIFPVFFFLVAALVCITTMNRMVEEQRTQIGVLKALGYSAGAIMSKYMIYSGLAAVSGCVFGFALGTWLFPEVIWYAYGIMYRVDKLLYVFHPGMTVLSLAVSLLCSVGTTWLSCRTELSEAASELMRPKAPKAGKRVFLEYLPFLWKRLSFLRKVSLRNIFRYKKRLFMMVVGISGCTALLVTGFGIKDSIADVAERQYETIQIYDVDVSFKNDISKNLEEELSGLAEFGLKEYICIMEKNLDLVTDTEMKSVILVAGEPERMNLFVDLHTKQGEQLPYPGIGEAVISNKLSEEYGIRSGDSITLRDENMRAVSLTVSGVQENYIYNYVYISEETWESQTGEEPERKKAYVTLEEDADAHSFSAAAMQLEETTNVTVNADTGERISNMMGSLDVIVLVIILCAAGLAFVVLYNLTNINITERIREIATIKVLGFYRKETSSYVFRENILLTILGMLVGFVLGHFLHLFVMGEIKVDMIAFYVYVSPLSYAYSGLLTLLFAWLVNLVMGRKLDAVSMTESLKSVD